MKLADVEHNINEAVRSGELSNRDLVQLIELAGEYLNLQTISKYAKDKNLSYNGVKNNREIVELFGCKLVIDNV
jgi:hypothetical protein